MTPGGPYWNKSGDYRDTNWHTCNVRNHEWVNRQLVSLLDIDGIGIKTIRALWEAEIKTAEDLINTNAQEIHDKLVALRDKGFRVNTSIKTIQGWQDQAQQMWKEEESRRTSADEKGQGCLIRDIP